MIIFFHCYSTAVKCNDNRTVLETLASLGASFDCASKVTYLDISEPRLDPKRRNKTQTQRDTLMGATRRATGAWEGENEGV